MLRLFSVEIRLVGGGRAAAFGLEGGEALRLRDLSCASGVTPLAFVWSRVQASVSSNEVRRRMVLGRARRLTSVRAMEPADVNAVYVVHSRIEKQLESSL